MILALRQRHRQLFVGLSLFLPVVFAVGICGRKPAPVMAGLPAALGPVRQPYQIVGQPRTNLFARLPLQVELLQAAGAPGHFAVQLLGGHDLVKPDLIAYWVPGHPVATDTIPDTAILLGAANPVPLALPNQATRSEGILVLYSLADGEVVDVSKPFSLPASQIPTP